jgi:hypothetical protein
VDDFIEESSAFPNGSQDDHVDAMTQAPIRWNQVPSHQVVEYYEPVQISGSSSACTINEGGVWQVT